MRFSIDCLNLSLRMISIIWLSGFCVVDADPAKLTEADRIALEEQLEAIQNQSDESVGGLYRRALADFRSAIRSDDATMELYLKCLEKVRFTDEKKKAADFREWKRRNKDRLKSSSMRMALRHQLSWILLSIEAARKSPEERKDLSQRAMAHLDQIFKNAEVLKDHRDVLNQDALSSVFARAYKLHIKVEHWPRSALDIAGIYEHVVMPQLRRPERIGSLRTAWKKRIEHEGLKVERWTREETRRIGTKESMRSSAFEKFLADTRPQLLWKMEVDCFKSGDERVAALNMVNHLKKYLTHKDAPEWIDGFQKLINPEKALAEEGAEKTTAETE